MSVNKNWIIKDKDLILSKDRFVFLARGYPEHKCINAVLKYYPTSKTPGFIFRQKQYTWNRASSNTNFLFKNLQYYSALSPTLIAVKKNQVKEVFGSKEGYQKLHKKNAVDRLEKLVLELGEFFQNNGIPEKSLGITGSLLLGCHNSKYSDIDFVIEGSKNFNRAIACILENQEFEPYSVMDWKKYYVKYNIQTQYQKNFRDFLKTAQRKHDRFFSTGTPVSIFNIRNKKEIRKEEKTVDLKNIKVKGRIISDKESSFYPSYYSVDITETNSPLEGNIKEVVAYGREYYLEGKKRDFFECEGCLQLVIPKSKKSYFRIKIGHLGTNFLPQGKLKIL